MAVADWLRMMSAFAMIGGAFVVAAIAILIWVALFHEDDFDLP